VKEIVMRFRVKDGLALQQKDLETWEKVLRKEAFESLSAYCDSCNSRLTEDNTGYDVKRGQDLAEYVDKLKYA
jgi:hypothetical protein